MTIRCEVEGCRGNAACLAGLSVALEKGLKRTFPGATGTLERPLINSVMRELKILVLAMQPSVRHLAKAAIPHVLDWSHEKEIWDGLGFELAGVRIVEGPRSRAPKEGGV